MPVGDDSPELSRHDRLKGQKPHRCNPELEEVIEALFEFPPALRKPWSEFIACMRASPSSNQSGEIKSKEMD
jgi:hypothetical protein